MFLHIVFTVIVFCFLFLCTCMMVTSGENSLLPKYSFLLVSIALTFSVFLIVFLSGQKILKSVRKRIKYIMGIGWYSGAELGAELCSELGAELCSELGAADAAESVLELNDISVGRPRSNVSVSQGNNSLRPTGELGLPTE